MANDLVPTNINAIVVPSAKGTNPLTRLGARCTSVAVRPPEGLPAKVYDDSGNLNWQLCSEWARENPEEALKRMGVQLPAQAQRAIDSGGPVTIKIGKVVNVAKGGHWHSVYAPGGHRREMSDEDRPMTRADFERWQEESKPQPKSLMRRWVGEPLLKSAFPRLGHWYAGEPYNRPPPSVVNYVDNSRHVHRGHRSKVYNIRNETHRTHTDNRSWTDSRTIHKAPLPDSIGLMVLVFLLGCVILGTAIAHGAHGATLAESVGNAASSVASAFREPFGVDDSPCPPCPPPPCPNEREPQRQVERSPDTYDAPYRPEREAEPEKPKMSFIRGEIGWHTLDRFEVAPIVVTSGPGGLIEPAFEIGDKIAAAHADTVIRAGDECSSACAMIWLAGEHRYLLGYAGFHAPSGETDWDGHKYRSHHAESETIAYYKRRGLSDEAIDWALSINPNSIKRLTPELAEKLGIKIETSWNGETYRGEKLANNRWRGW